MLRAQFDTNIKILSNMGLSILMELFERTLVNMAFLFKQLVLTLHSRTGLLNTKIGILLR